MNFMRVRNLILYGLWIV